MSSPTRKPQPQKRLFAWATKGRDLPADLYVSPAAAKSAYREIAKRRRVS
jgi:hypothetical protein